MPLVSKTFSQIITFTRASSATYFDATGTLQTATTDAPRFDYDPSTLAAQGFLIEESRTNSIRNNTMQGAAAGTPGTLPTNWQISGAGAGTLDRDIVGTGTAAGITYIDIRYYGTTSTTNLNICCEPNISSVAVTTGQTWTGSNYVAIVGGSIANLTAVRAVILAGRTSGGSGTTDNTNSGDQKAVLTATMQRFSTPITIADATSASLQLGVALAFSSGVAIDITLRIGLPQLEQGAFATSVIPTTSAAVTRAADVASVNTLSPWYNAAEGTLYAEFVVPFDSSVSIFPAAAYVSDGTFNNVICLYERTVDDTRRAAIRVGNVQQFDQSNGSTYTYGTVAKTAIAFKINDVAFSANGTAPTTATSASIPSVNVLGLGSTGSIAGSLNALNGYLRRAVYYPRRLSNAELQAITS